MIVYDIRNGRIDAFVDNLNYSMEYPKEFRENLRSLVLESYPENIFEHRVVNGNLVKMNKVELFEWRTYRRILSDKERHEIEVLNKLTPTYDEIQKAENIIEILELLSEVL